MSSLSFEVVFVEKNSKKKKISSLGFYFRSVRSHLERNPNTNFLSTSKVATIDKKQRRNVEKKKEREREIENNSSNMQIRKEREKKIFK